jgi:hypothetical protein
MELHAGHRLIDQKKHRPKTYEQILRTSLTYSRVHAVVHAVEAISYKTEGNVFDSRWSHFNFFLLNTRWYPKYSGLT